VSCRTRRRCVLISFLKARSVLPLRAQCIRGVSPTSACWRKLDRIHTHFAWLTLWPCCRFNDDPSQRMRWLRCKQPLRVPSKRSAGVSMSGVIGLEVNWLSGDRIGVPTMGLVAKGDSIRGERNMNGGLHPVFQPNQILPTVRFCRVCDSSVMRTRECALRSSGPFPLPPSFLLSFCVSPPPLLILYLLPPAAHDHTPSRPYRNHQLYNNSTHRQTISPPHHILAIPNGQPPAK